MFYGARCKIALASDPKELERTPRGGCPSAALILGREMEAAFPLKLRLRQAKPTFITPLMFHKTSGSGFINECASVVAKMPLILRTLFAF